MKYRSTLTNSLRRRGDAGYSMVELMVVVAVGCILSGMAALRVTQTMPDIKANSARQAVHTQLIAARELAISKRRPIEVEFLGTGQIRLTRVELDGTRTELNRTFLEGGVRWTTYAGVPDTPEAFGNSTAIEFNGVAKPAFLSDGSFVDTTGQPLSGTVFLGVPNKSTTARAVTVFGGTGRVTAYRWSGTVWQR